MLVRLILGGMLACSFVALDAAASADPVSARTFKGKTAQGYRIKLAVKGGAFKILRFEADLKCRDGSTLLLEESGFLWTKVGGNGMFRDAQFGRTDSVYFKGRLNERRIRGRVRLTDKLRGGIRCSSRWIRFGATPG
jgi:hypothetical protein